MVRFIGHNIHIVLWFGYFKVARYGNSVQERKGGGRFTIGTAKIGE